MYEAQKGEGDDTETKIKPSEQPGGLVPLSQLPLPSRFLLNFQINDREISRPSGTVLVFPFAYCPNAICTLVTVSYTFKVPRTNFNS